MAIYHMSIAVGSRSQGRSAVAAAAYRAGERLRDERYGEERDYGRKQGVLHREVMLPDGAPERFADRETLWNEVEAVERRKDAQLFREFQPAIPHELDRAEQIGLVREYGGWLAGQGMVVDIAVHSGHTDPRNIHAHMMSTMREVGEDGFGAKNREWNSRAELERWRDEWEGLANRYLERHYERERTPERLRSYIDSRSYAGPAVRAIEERAEREAREQGREYEPVTAVRRENREIEARNEERRAHAVERAEREWESREPGREREAAGRAARELDRVGLGGQLREAVSRADERGRDRELERAQREAAERNRELERAQREAAERNRELEGHREGLRERVGKLARHVVDRIDERFEEHGLAFPVGGRIGELAAELREGRHERAFEFHARLARSDLGAIPREPDPEERQCRLHDARAALGQAERAAEGYPALRERALELHADVAEAEHLENERMRSRARESFHDKAEHAREASAAQKRGYGHDREPDRGIERDDGGRDR